MDSKCRLCQGKYVDNGGIIRKDNELICIKCYRNDEIEKPDDTLNIKHPGIILIIIFGVYAILILFGHYLGGIL